MNGVVTEIIIPIFGLVAIGYACGKRRWLDEAAIRGVALYVFTIAVPIMLFRAMAIAQLPDSVPWQFFLSYYGAAWLVFLTGLAGGRYLGLDRGESALAGFGACYANLVLIGIPMVLRAFGERAAVPLFLLVGSQALFMFPPITMALESNRHRRRSTWTRLGASIRGVVTNQYIIALAAGLLYNLTDLPLPTPVDAVAVLIGQSATPCALFALGASLSLYSVTGRVFATVTICIAKLAVMPALVWFIGDVLMDIDRLWLAVAVLVSAMPVGINMYLFGQRYQVGVGLATTATVISTGVSVVTITVVLLLLGPV